jgi:hypothetical protein
MDSFRLLDLPSDIHLLIIVSYLDDTSILALRHVNHYFHDLELPSQHRPARSYETCVAFHRMWEAELRARHLSAGESHPLRPFIRPVLPHFLPCYECLKWLPGSAFAHSQKTAKRRLAERDAHKRFCIACGIRHGFWPSRYFVHCSEQDDWSVEVSGVPAYKQSGGEGSEAGMQSPSALGLPQRRRRKRMQRCQKCGDDFIHLWYGCLGCYNVYAADWNHDFDVDLVDQDMEAEDQRNHRVGSRLVFRRTRDAKMEEIGRANRENYLAIVENGPAAMGDASSSLQSAFHHTLSQSHGIDALVGREYRCADCWSAGPNMDKLAEDPHRKCSINFTNASMSHKSTQDPSWLDHCWRCRQRFSSWFKVPRSRLRQSRQMRNDRNTRAYQERRRNTWVNGRMITETHGFT